MNQQFYTQDTNDKTLIKKALDKVVNRISCTMGPQGRLVAIDRGDIILEVKDGATVAKYQSYPDYEGLVCRLVIDACRQTEKVVGDGTTATAVLIQAIYNVALDMIEEDPQINVHEMKSGMNYALEYIEGFFEMIRCNVLIDGKIREENLFDLAMISANGNEDLARMVSDLIMKLGPNGKVIVQRSERAESYTEHYPGYSVDGGLLSHLFANQPQGCTFINPLVVIINEKIEFVEQITPILKAWNARYGQQEIVNNQAVTVNPKPIVFVVQDMYGDALTLLARNAQKGTHRIAVIRAPSSGMQRQILLSDLQLVTNTGNVFDQLKGVRLDSFDGGNADYEFGYCDRFFADNSQAIFYIDEKKIVDSKPLELAPKFVDSVSDQLAHYQEAHPLDGPTYTSVFLKDLIEERSKEILIQIDNDLQNAEFHRDRIARLSSGIGIIYIGGATESEHEQLKTVIDDTHRACYSAIRDGFVPGAGGALLKAGTALEESPDVQEMAEKGEKSISYCYGIDCIIAASRAPLNQILRNSYYDDDRIDSIITQIKYPGNLIIDAKKNIIDTFPVLKIIDPKMSPLVSLRNAISVAGNLLSTKYFQILKSDEPGR